MIAPGDYVMITAAELAGMAPALAAAKRRAAAAIGLKGEIHILLAIDTAINSGAGLPPHPPPPLPPPMVEIPFDQWPLWAKRVKRKAKPEDLGVGDTVHRRIHDRKLGRLVVRWIKLCRIPCGCEKRRDDWNIFYPYAKLL